MGNQKSDRKLKYAIKENFAALSYNGISLLISFARTFVFQVILVLILSVFFQLNGVWFSVVFADLLGLLLTAIFFVFERKRYQYA